MNAWAVSETNMYKKDIDILLINEVAKGYFYSVQ